MYLTICLYSLSYIWENGVSYYIKELCNLSLQIQGPFIWEGGTLIIRHGRKAPRWWPLCDCQSNLVPIVWCNQIWLTPSFFRKICLCLSHLVPEIHGHKVGLILHHFFPFCINFHLNFRSNWPPFSLVLDLIDPSFYKTLDLIGSIFLSCAEPHYRKFGEVPPHPRPFTHNLMHAHLTIGNHSQCIANF